MLAPGSCACRKHCSFSRAVQSDSGDAVFQAPRRRRAACLADASVLGLFFAQVRDCESHLRRSHATAARDGALPEELFSGRLTDEAPTTEEEAELASLLETSQERAEFLQQLANCENENMRRQFSPT